MAEAASELLARDLAGPPVGLAGPSTLGVGVVGAGYWGPKLIRNFQACEGARVVGVCDRDPARLADVARQDSSLALHAEVEDLLADPAVDAVAIATPVNSHHGIARRALESGRHVLVEKPLAASVREAEELLELAERKGLTLMVDHTFLYHPAVEKMAELLQTGALGKPLYFDSVRVNLGLFQPDVNVLWDLAPHDLSILAWLFPQMPEAVSATGASHWGKGTENIAYLSLVYPDDFLAHVHVSWLAPVKVRNVTLSGDRQMVVYDDNQVLEKIKVYDRGIAESLSTEERHRHRVEYRLGDMHAPHIPGREALAAEAADFVHCARTGARPRSHGECGLAVVRVLEKAQESIARGGAPVPLL